MEYGLVPLASYRSCNIVHGEIVFAHLVGNDAEKMQGVRLMGVDGENLAVSLLGGLEPARLMVIQRGADQRLRHVWHGENCTTAGLCGNSESD